MKQKKQIKVLIVLALLFFSIFIAGFIYSRAWDSYQRENGKAKIPEGKYEGKPYYEIESLFENAGFTRVYVEKVEDLITGWIHEEGEVIDVSVGGSKKYNTGEYVDKDLKIIIRYHVFPD